MVFSNFVHNMKLTVLGLMILFPTVSLVKVFNFNLEAVNVSLSRALLENVPSESLPRQFTICSSHLQVELSLPTSLYILTTSASFCVFAENYNLYCCRAV